MNRVTRRQALKAGLAGLAAVTVGSPTSQAATTALHEGSFHYDHVLGTSLDVWVHASEPATTEAVEHLVLAEIERLRGIFSTYDPNSELSRLNRTDQPVAVSNDLRAVLGEYEVWQRRSRGACSAQTGALVKLWADAERCGIQPDAATLEALARQTGETAFHLNGDTVTRLTDQSLNLNSVAKGYILQRTTAAVRSNIPDVTALLLNLGGDLCGWNPAGWIIGVQDPFRPEENAVPLTVMRLQAVAVATSGGYQRGYTVSDRHYSHLIDPRTGWPADAVAAATVTAADSVTANVLATTLCILNPADGLRLVAATLGAECLIVTPDGQQLRSAGFAAFELPADDSPKKDGDQPDKATGDPWPDDYQVTVNLELPKPEGGRARRPYVAVWVEDADGKAVRTVTVWGDNRRWLSELSGWWKLAKDDKELVKAVTRATRAPGKYAVAWDGKDDAGKPLPQGTYTIKVEVHREHGKHVVQTGKIVCAAEGAKVKLDKNAEAEETAIEYGKKE